MTEQELKEMAGQLRQPNGEAGVEIGNFMNDGNKAMNEAAIDALELNCGDCLLEIGMGNGNYVPSILAKFPGIQYIGCDFSELMVAEATKNHQEHIKSKQADFKLSEAQSLPLDDHSIDCILTVNTLYFWEDPQKELEELKRVLKPRGQLVIAIRPKHIIEVFPFIKYGFDMYTQEGLVQLLETNGFQIDQITEGIEEKFEMDGQWYPLGHLVAKARVG